MYDWIVVVKEDYEYRVKAPTRYNAVKQAVHLYKEETTDPELITILSACVLGCYMIGRRNGRRAVSNA